MRFVIDAQLPPALAHYLIAEGHEARHVSDIGLLSAPDREIWRYALDNAATILTKDEDFVSMRSLAESGPAIVWIRFGNTTKTELLRKMKLVLPSVLAALRKGEAVVEIADA